MHLNTNVQTGWMQIHVQLYQIHAVMVSVMLMNFATHVNLTVVVVELRYAMHKLVDVTPQLEYVKHHVARHSLIK